MSTKHSIVAENFQKNKDLATWHDQTLWMVRAKRDKISKEIPEWEKLRDMACAIKMYSNSHLDLLLQEFEKNAVAMVLMFTGQKMRMSTAPLFIIFCRDIMSNILSRVNPCWPKSAD